MMPASWRIPGRAERERDRSYLAHFLTPAIADAIASMPCVVIGEAAAPLSLRIDAFLYRSGELLRSWRPK